MRLMSLFPRLARTRRGEEAAALNCAQLLRTIQCCNPRGQPHPLQFGSKNGVQKRKEKRDRDRRVGVGVLERERGRERT